MSELPVSLIVIVAGIIAFGFQQWLRAIYEHAQERRSLEIGYLLEAYRALSVFRNRTTLSNEDSGKNYTDTRLVNEKEAEAMELAVSTAGIHGTQAVVQAALEYADSGNEDWDPYDLLKALRKDIRDKLRREPLPDDLGIPFINVLGEARREGESED